MKLFTAFLLAIFISGCATDPQVAKAVADANAEVAKVPTLKISCLQGCEATYTDPRDRHMTAMPTNGWDAMKAVAGTVSNVAVGVSTSVALGNVAVEGFKAMRGSGTVTNTNVNTENTSVANTASGAGASTGGTGHYEQVGPDSGNTTSTSTATTTTTTDNHAVDNHAVSTTSGDTTNGL